MPMAANATPANQSGNIRSNRSGTIVFGSAVPPLVIGLTPAASAIRPSSASRPSMKL